MTNIFEEIYILTMDPQPSGIAIRVPFGDVRWQRYSTTLANMQCWTIIKQVTGQLVVKYSTTSESRTVDAEERFTEPSTHASPARLWLDQYVRKVPRCRLRTVVNPKLVTNTFARIISLTAMWLDPNMWMLTVESSKYGVTFTITPRIAKPYEISGRGPCRLKSFGHVHPPRAKSCVNQKRVATAIFLLLFQ